MLLIFGWDVRDTRQVLQERKLGKQFLARLEEIDSTHSRPDYILLNGQNKKAFVDAKDLNVNVFSDKATAFQIRSYAWSARIPCSFVSNFEQFAIFDCRPMPSPEQPANHGAIQLEISEYIDKFDILYDHLFQENIKENRL
jgi:type I site-specific restriction endonuclease